MSGLALRTTRLTRHFGPLVALHPLDLEVPAGEALAILGPNGAGKSTLLRLLAGLARPSGGHVEVERAGRSRVARRRHVGLVSHATFLYPALTARENLVLAGRLYGVADADRRAGELLAEEELEGVGERRAGSFSRGMAQRLALARGRVHDPSILLLDEPFTELDPRAATRLEERLRVLRGKRTLLLVTHDLSRAAALCSRALVLLRGRAGWLAEEAMAEADRLQAAYRRALAPQEPER